jgi:hypothetical protein
VIHKFKVGQSLELLPSGLTRRTKSACEVVSQLPFEGRAVQYRIQVKAETHQRIVSEADLQVPRN